MVWFNQNQDWHEDDRVTARQIVIKRWMESYAGEERSSVQSESTSDTVNTEPAVRIFLVLNFLVLNSITRDLETSALQMVCRTGATSNVIASVSRYDTSVPRWPAGV